MNSLVKVPPYSKLNFQGKIFFTQNWCNITLSIDLNYIICKHRLCALSLKIETDEIYNIDRNQRFCNNCSKHTVEDEYHFMLECSKYNDLRKEYIQTDYW
jgi:hypothetical protein